MRPARGKIAWTGLLLALASIPFPGGSLPGLDRPVTVDAREGREAIVAELASLPEQQRTIEDQRQALRATISAAEDRLAHARSDLRGARREARAAQLQLTRAQQAVRRAKSTILRTVRRATDPSTMRSVVRALRQGKVPLLPASLAGTATAWAEARDQLARLEQAWSGASNALRIASKSTEAIRRELATLRRRESEATRRLRAVQRRTVVLERRLVALDRPRPTPKPVAVATPSPKAPLRAVASLTGSTGSAATPLTFSDLSTERERVEAFVAGSEAARAQRFFSWPIEPSQGISAYYHDELYASRMGQDHFAIDIVADQGTEIVAPADGLVLKAEDSGTGFQYVLLLHKNGYLTLYGHVSAFRVEAGDLVRQGAIIALSGGQPGTPGAGKNTTGPHLHFEVWKDNVRLDPLRYLDPSRLPDDATLVDPDQVQVEPVGIDRS